LSFDRFHLVVHDIGGPVGFEVAAAAPERVASLTVLNSPVEVDIFRRPWVMEPFGHRGIGEIYLRIINKPLFRWLMRLQGVADLTKITNAELDAYLDLLRRVDGGRAFLKIMRGFERTPAKRQLCLSVLRSGQYPVEIVWGEADPALKITVEGEQARVAAGLDQIHRLPAKHFLQEDQAPARADLVAKLGSSLTLTSSSQAPATNWTRSPQPALRDQDSPSADLFEKACREQVVVGQYAEPVVHPLRVRQISPVGEQLRGRAERQASVDPVDLEGERRICRGTAVYSLVEHRRQPVRAEERGQCVHTSDLDWDRETAEEAVVVGIAWNQRMTVMQVEVHRLADGADATDQLQDHHACGVGRRLHLVSNLRQARISQRKVRPGHT
jgi:hypothetical protein